MARVLKKVDIKIAFLSFVWPLGLQWASQFVHISQRSLRKSFGLLILGIVYFLFRLIKKIDRDVETRESKNQAPETQGNRKGKKKGTNPESERVSRLSRAKRKASNLKKERKKT